MIRGEKMWVSLKTPCRVLFTQSPDENAAADRGGGIADGRHQRLIRDTEASKEAVRFRDPMVNSHIALIDIVRFDGVAEIIAGHPRTAKRTRHIGRRHQTDQFEGGGVEPVQRNLVVGKRLPDYLAVLNHSRVRVEDGVEAAEIPSPPSQWRHRGEKRMSRSDARALIVHEEERPVLSAISRKLNGSAQGRLRTGSV